MFGVKDEDQNTVPVLYKHPQSWSLGGEADSLTYCSGNDSAFQKAYNRLSGHTTTLYAQRPSLILPQDKDGNYKMFNPTARNEYLHILMPLKDVNILNSPGIDAKTNDKENVMVEIGCKIFEVNHVYPEPLPSTLNMSKEIIQM